MRVAPTLLRKKFLFPERFSRLAALSFVVSLVVAFVVAAHAQDTFKGWQWQNPRPQGNSINSIRFSPDKRRGWAVGANGVVLTTDNGGFEWEEQASPANTTLYDMYVKDRSRVVIDDRRSV